MNIQKKILILILYWMIFIIIPGYIAFNYKFTENNFDLPGYISFFVLFIVPFLFIIPYRFAKLNFQKEKLYFILIGLIFPYLFILLYLYISYKRDFKPDIL